MAELLLFIALGTLIYLCGVEIANGVYRVEEKIEKLIKTIEGR